VAHDVFICHATEDKGVADAVCASLEARGIRCWVAPRDIAPGRDYAAAIIDALATARAVVLVFSTYANSSPHVKRELERGVSRGLPIIPIRLDEAVPTAALEYFISGAHWLDAMTPPLAAHLQHLGDAVEVVLSQPGTAPPPTMTSAVASAARAHRRRVLFLVAGIVSVLVIAGVVVAVATSGGDDSDSKSDRAGLPIATITGPNLVCANARTDNFVAVVHNAVSGTWTLPGFNLEDTDWPEATTQYVNPNDSAIGNEYEWQLAVQNTDGDTAVARHRFRVVAC
jgi:hypothetical protein